VPVTLTKTNLCARLEDGETIVGETNIDVPKHNPNLKIEKLFLDPPAQANPRAIQKIMESEYIFIGPGDLYSSILPNLVVTGIPEALRKTAAKENLRLQHNDKIGETKGFKVSDFVAKLKKASGAITWIMLFFSKKFLQKRELISI